MISKETMLAGLEQQYDRRLHQWMDARTEEERAGIKELLDQIDSMMQQLRSAEIP